MNFRTISLDRQMLHVCGYNTFHQLGLLHSNPVTSVTQVEISSPILKVVANWSQTLILTSQTFYFYLHD